MLKKLFGGQINSITIAAALVAGSSLVSRFLGIFRDRILAGEFGAGETLDIYYAAFRIPDLIFNLLVLGALSAGFIPIFTNLIKKKNEAWKLASLLLNILGLLLVAISGFGILLAPIIMKLVVPGFDTEKLLTTIELSRIMFLSPIFLGISSIFGGILQSFKRFFVYSLSPILYNIGIILGALYLVPIWGVHGLAWGVVLGAFLHMIIQIPLVFRLGFKYKLCFDLRNKYLRKVAVMMVPRTLSLGIAQINLLVITIIASTLEDGSLSIFNFANNLQSFPISIFGISFAVAAFPTLAAFAFDKKELTKYFSKTLRQVLFFMVPATVLLLALRAQIIRVILGTGNFDWQDTVLTIDTLGFFTISLFAQALIPLLVRVFYARHDSKIPFITGLISAIANVFLSYYFADVYGVAGLALAFSVANILNFVMLWTMLKIEIGDLDEIKILTSVFKFSAASIICGIAIQAMKLFVWPYVDMTKLWGVLSQGLVAGCSGLFVYIAFCTLFRCEELIHFYDSIKKRLPWKKINIGDQGEARGI